MHSMKSKSKSNINYFFNGGFYGNVEIHIDDNVTIVPYEDLLALVAGHIRLCKVTRLENISDEEILGIYDDE